MQKKLLAVAVAGALAAPAAALAQSSVQVYGRASLGIDNYRATGAAAPAGNIASRNRIYDFGSRVGFRGTENLGGGMQAYFVIESGVNIDSGNQTGQNGATNSSAGYFAGRDSRVGLRGNWGDVSFGRQSVFWTNGLNDLTAALYINYAASGLLTGYSPLSPGAGLTTRVNNTLYYTSPRMGGFSARISYSPQSESSAAYTGTGQSKNNIWGLNINWRSGPWYVQGDILRNRDIGGVAGTDFNAHKLGVSWGYGSGSRIGFIYQRSERERAGADPSAALWAAGDTIKANIYSMMIDHRIGPWQLLAGYAWTSNLKGGSISSSNSKSRNWHIGARYNLSKRTGVYVSFNQVRNDANVRTDMAGGNYTSAGSGAPGTVPVGLGADPRVWAFGVMHNF